MKIKITSLFIFLAFLGCNAQSIVNKNIDFKIDSSSYFIGNKKIVSLIYEIYNNDNEAVWLWIVKDEIEKISDSLKIRRHFFQKPEGSDFSLYQIAMDRNVETFTPVLFDAFTKRILPKNHFTIQVITKGKITESIKKEVINYLDHHIIFYNENDMLKVIPSINEMGQAIFYKQDLITIYLDMLMLRSTDYE